MKSDDDRWRLAVEASGDALWDWSPADGRIFSSARLGALLGLPEPTGAIDWRSHLHPDDRDAVLASLERSIGPGAQPFDTEFRLRGPGGRYRWFSARGGAVARDAGGVALRFACLLRDITTDREQRETIQASERLWQFALEGHGDALWDWTLETGVINISPSFRAITGWPDGAALRGNDIWPERIHPDDLRKAMAAFNAHLSGGRAMTEVEFRLQVNDGTYRWVALRGKVMERDALGRPSRMIGTVRDVHDHYLSIAREKRQERELARAAHLIHLGEMASVLSHELNQPLTALRNFSGVALRRLEELGPAGNRIAEPLKMISEQALRAGDIVHRVRSFVRRGGLKSAPVAMNKVVQSVVRFAEFEARAHAVQLLLQLAEPLPLVNGDQVQLEQVLSNLVKNAIDAMSAVPWSRDLVIRTQVDHDGMVEVAVIDCGEGLAESVRQDPFAPFATTKPDGVGLGLAICRTIIENHGGRMWVESSDAQGTTFCFALPSMPAA
ncbi:MAG: PAS domain-containing protein [Zoogloea sp.]|nr:PAS domain-containing protein [Zoogloea sp.]